jgi:FkbM family methyltransferase
MSSRFNWRRAAAALIGRENYDTLTAIRRARESQRNESADDRRRAALYGRWVRPGDLVLDIGANHGNRTRVFAGLGARVVALEPQRHCARALAWIFRREPRVQVVAAAAGRDGSPKTITQFSTDVLSSMNPEWIATARRSGRFGDLVPVREVEVPGITLDQLIARHGAPAFTKIDVEGYEAEVLAGLTRAAGTVSFEITPEMSSISRTCVRHLHGLGYTRFQFSSGESMALDGPWLDADAMDAFLVRLAAEPSDFGDIYALAPGLTS